MLYDLTQPVTNELPVYPGDPHPDIKPLASVEHDGYAISSLTIGTHTGTHMDAPMHMIAGGKQPKDYRVDRFIVPAVCIDVRSGFDVNVIASVLNTPGLGVLFCTGASIDKINYRIYTL